MICCLPVWSAVVRWGFQDEDGWSARWGKNRRSEMLVGHLYSGKCGSNFEYFRGSTVANIYRFNTASCLALGIGYSCSLIL
jgi:hypothetical protein